MGTKVRSLRHGFKRFKSGHLTRSRAQYELSSPPRDPAKWGKKF